MTPITTIQARLPCPGCGVVGLRTVALQSRSQTTELPEASSAQALPEGAPRGVVSDCEACWGRRADRITAARQRLQATGELTSLGPGREDAWQGVPLSRSEEAFECAFASAMMKLADGEALPPPPVLESLEIASLREESPVDEPELVEA